MVDPKPHRPPLRGRWVGSAVRCAAEVLLRSAGACRVAMEAGVDVAVRTACCMAPHGSGRNGHHKAGVAAGDDRSRLVLRLSASASRG